MRDGTLMAFSQVIKFQFSLLNSIACHTVLPPSAAELWRLNNNRNVNCVLHEGRKKIRSTQMKCTEINLGSLFNIYTSLKSFNPSIPDLLIHHE